MAGEFALNGNEQITRLMPDARTFEWFKVKLRETGVGPLHITWYAKQEYEQVPQEHLDRYVALRRTHPHAQALAKAQQEE